MPVSASYQPTTLDFTTANIGLVQIAHAPADALITASIVYGGLTYNVDAILVYDVTTVTVDPDELPPNHKGPLPTHKVYTQVGASNGSTPLQVIAGQFVEVHVMDTAGTGVPIAGDIPGTLLVQGDTWDPITIPLTKFVGQVTTAFNNHPLYAAVRQGEIVDVALHVSAVTGGGTDVTYDMSSDTGLSCPPATVHVSGVTSVPGTLRIAAALDAPLGDHNVNIFESAFANRQRDTITPGGFTVHVAPQPVAHKVRIAILRYEWKTPPANTPAVTKWDDFTFQEIFSNPNGWSLRDYWKRATFGLIDLQITLQPWRILPSAQAVQPNRQKLIGLIMNQAQVDGVASGTYDNAIAFINGPSPDHGAVEFQPNALFDQHGTLPFFQHEIGIMLGFYRTWGLVAPNTYAPSVDDYCLMGASLHASHNIPYAPWVSNAGVVPSFFVSERRPSAAALYRFVPAFAASAAVRHMPTATIVTVVLTALCWASLDEPVLAVVATSHGEITIEYRFQIGDDLGVLPAIVIHSIGRRTATTPDGSVPEDRIVAYEGVIYTNLNGTFRLPEGDLTITYDAATNTGRTVTVTIA